MKYLKSINEGWLDKINPFAKSEISLIKEKGEKIFNQYFNNIDYLDGVIFQIMDREETPSCYVKFITNLNDEFGDILTYLFIIYIKEDVIYLKPLGGSTQVEEFYKFEELNFHIDDMKQLDDILILFAEKLKPFITNIIEVDKKFNT